MDKFFLFSYLKSLFDKKLSVYSAGFSGVILLIDLFESYFKETIKIDRVSMEKLGVSISGEFGFFDILKSAQVSFFGEFLGFFICFFVILVLLNLIKVCIVNELQAGWKRLGVVLVIVAVIYSALRVGASSLSWFIVYSIFFSVLVLLSVVAVRWVVRGFEKGA